MKKVKENKIYLNKSKVPVIVRSTFVLHALRKKNCNSPPIINESKF